MILLQRAEVQQSLDFEEGFERVRISTLEECPCVEEAQGAHESF